MKLIDLKTLAEQTSLSVQTYRNYTKTGMPHYRVGRKIMVDLDEFKQWLTQFKSQAVPTENAVGSMIDEILTNNP